MAIPLERVLFIKVTSAIVGLGLKQSPVYLRTGQQMQLGIAGLGKQRQSTVSARTGGAA